MAATNAILLLSSPLRPTLERDLSKKHTAISSSPAMPSPSQLFSRNAPSLVCGTRGTPIHEDAVAGFASVSSLLRNSQSIDSLAKLDGSAVKHAKVSASNQEAEKPQKRKPKEAPIVVGSALKEGNDAQAIKILRKPRTSKAKADASVKHGTETVRPVEVNSGSEVVADKAKSKPRIRKSKEPTQTTIKKNKVIKVGTISTTLGGSKCTGKKKKVCADEEVVEPSAANKELVSIERKEAIDLCLDEAIRRRTNWTPIKDTSNGFVNLDGSEGDISGPLDQGTPKTIEKIKDFGDLFGDYAHISSSTRQVPEIMRSLSGEALTKRRKVELVATKLCMPAEPAKPKKSKSPKKKAQTVTAKATAPFAAPKTVPVNNLLQYLAPNLATGSADQVNREPPEHVSAAKSTSKSGAARGKPVKATVQAPILLSPDKAMEKAMDQNLLFGTSSQLARDDSPTFVRELQQAMKVSESLLTDAHTAIGEAPSASRASGSTNESNLSLFAASRSLWSVAARDLNGSLQQAEVIDLSRTLRPQLTKSSSGQPAERPKQVQRVSIVQETNTAPEVVSGWTNIDDIRSPEHPQISTEADYTEVERLIHRSLAEAALKNRPKSRSPAKQPRQAKKSKEPPDQQAPAGMPNYKGFTASELNKEVASFHFKPVKKREDQISLLERCWESKNRIALQSLEPNVNISQPRGDVSEEASAAVNPPKDADPAKKKRGRPPKTVEASTAQKDDEDIAKTSSPAKPRGRPKKAATGTIVRTKKPAKSPKKPKAPTQSTSSTTPNPRPPPSEISDSDTTPRPTSRRLFSSSQPTTAPLTVPIPTTNSPSSPPPTPLTHTTILSKISQAIATYPPTHNMKSLSFYEKILMYDPVVLEDLTAWLNTEGLGRVGVDEEIEVGLVKEWCESQSVCCLWRENLRGGTRARY